MKYISNLSITETLKHIRSIPKLKYYPNNLSSQKGVSFRITKGFQIQHLILNKTEA